MDWTIELEEMVDTKLKKWKKDDPVRSVQSVQYRWQFHQTHILLDVFKDVLHFTYHNPRAHQRFEWYGLTDETFDRVQDKVGNLAQITMHPPICE